MVAPMRGQGVFLMPNTPFFVVDQQIIALVGKKIVIISKTPVNFNTGELYLVCLHNHSTSNTECSARSSINFRALFVRRGCYSDSILSHATVKL